MLFCICFRTYLYLRQYMSGARRVRTQISPPWAAAPRPPGVIALTSCHQETRVDVTYRLKSTTLTDSSQRHLQTPVYVTYRIKSTSPTDSNRRHLQTEVDVTYRLKPTKPQSNVVNTDTSTDSSSLNSLNTSWCHFSHPLAPAFKSL